MIQKLFIVGATGNVGKELVKQIIENKDGDLSRHANPTRIVGLASRSRGFIYSDEGIEDGLARGFSEKKVGGWSMYKELPQLIGSVKDSTVFVDVTDGREELLDFHLRVIEHGEHRIVTANKYPLTLCTFQQFNKLTNDYDRYGFGCSVMAGAGTVHFLRNCPDVNDPVIRIEGCMSGTLAYVSTCLENGARFSDIVRGARGKYTEPHPADDLDGGDVTRKALILARTCGLDVRPGNIGVVPFIPGAYIRERDVEKFLGSLVYLDDAFYEQVAAAREVGKVLRYVATVSGKTDCGPKIVVGPKFVDKNSGLGLLRGTDNKITIWTEKYANGWSLGPVAGAGTGITARNIRDNLLDALRGRKARLNI